MVQKIATASQNVTLYCNSNSSGGTYGNIFRMRLLGHDLVIHNVYPNDTGLYTCLEDSGDGEHHKTLLTISGFSFDHR